MDSDKFGHEAENQTRAKNGANVHMQKLGKNGAISKLFHKQLFHDSIAAISRAQIPFVR